LGKILTDVGVGAPQANLKINVKLTTTNSNFNRSITVQAPVGAQKLESILLPLLKLQKIKADISRIELEADSIFYASKNYYLLCKNGFLNGSKTTSYGRAFITAANDIIKQGGKNPICFAGATSYCVSTQVADGSYICTSNTASEGTVKCVSAQTVCR